MADDDESSDDCVDEEPVGGTGKYVTELGAFDVLLGRGTGPSMHEGNVHFRKAVEDLKPSYVSTSSRKMKKDIVRQAVHTIQAKNGRFLTKLTKSELKMLGLKGKTAYEVVGDSVAMEKTKQAIRYVHYKKKEPTTLKRTAEAEKDPSDSKAQKISGPTSISNEGELQSIAPRVPAGPSATNALQHSQGKEAGGTLLDSVGAGPCNIVEDTVGEKDSEKVGQDYHERANPNGSSLMGNITPWDTSLSDPGLLSGLLFNQQWGSSLSSGGGGFLHSSSRSWLHDHNASMAHRANPMLFSPSLPQILQQRAQQAILESQGGGTNILNSGVNLFSSTYPQRRDHFLTSSSSSNFSAAATTAIDPSTRTSNQQQQNLGSIQGMFPFLSSEGSPSSTNDPRFLAMGATAAGTGFKTAFFDQGVPQQLSKIQVGGRMVQPDSVAGRPNISTLAHQSRNEQIRAYIEQVQEERRRIFGSILSSPPPR